MVLSLRESYEEFQEIGESYHHVLQLFRRSLFIHSLLTKTRNNSFRFDVDKWRDSFDRCLNKVTVLNNELDRTIRTEFYAARTALTQILSNSCGVIFNINCVDETNMLFDARAATFA